MDIGYTYSSASGVRVSVYAPPGFEPIDEMTLTSESGAQVEFIRVSDRTLECGRVANVSGACTNFECHRAVLGKCQCGRHEFGVRLEKAGNE